MNNLNKYSLAMSRVVGRDGQLMVMTKIIFINHCDFHLYHNHRFRKLMKMTIKFNSQWLLDIAIHFSIQNVQFSISI